MRNVPVLVGGLALAGLVGAYAYQSREMQSDRERMDAQTQEALNRRIETPDLASLECRSFVSAINTQRRLQEATAALTRHPSDAGRPRSSSIPALCANQVSTLIRPGLSEADTATAQIRAGIIARICEAASDTRVSILDGAALCAQY